jgi:hypothetical protein
MKFRDLFLLTLFQGVSAFAQPLPPQNVILITIDGVRYSDVFSPQKPELFSRKGGYPLQKTLQWVKKREGYAYGTQTQKDQMVIVNSSGLSLPGYKVIFSGRPELVCTQNKGCDFPKAETLVDRLMNEYQDPKKVALFSSWNQIQYATEGSQGVRATQSLGLNGLRNFDVKNKTDQSFYEAFLKIHQLSRSESQLPPWHNARWDRYTFGLAQHYLKSYKPRFLYLSFLDTDEWAHKGSMKSYLEALSEADERIMSLIQELQKDKEAYVNTSFVITTDHGRGETESGFSHHGIRSNGTFIDGSEKIWAFVIPSSTLQKFVGLERSSHGVQNRYSQLDIRATVEYLLNLKRSSKQIGFPLVRTVESQDKRSYTKP